MSEIDEWKKTVYSLPKVGIPVVSFEACMKNSAKQFKISGQEMKNRFLGRR